MPTAIQNSSVSPRSPTQDDSMRRNPMQINKSNKDDPLGWNWTSPARVFTRRSSSIPLSDPEFTTPEYLIENGFILQDSRTGTTFPGMSDDSFLDVPSSKSSDSLFVGLDTPNLTWPTTSQHPSDYGSNWDEPCGEKEFASLLEHCTRLQRHLQQTRDLVTNSDSSISSTTTAMTSTVSNNQLQEMLGDIDASCNFIFGLYGQGVLSQPEAQLRCDLDCASASLATSIIFKIFQVCDALLDCEVLKNHCLDDRLLHKRLDFNITQARIVFSRIEQLTQSGLMVSQSITKKAASIEERFKLLV
ncbi:hypothetical protein MMC29_006735 [Sticta canariensis]|nr:hypothetical protein [Sticta canariensis]